MSSSKGSTSKKDTTTMRTKPKHSSAARPSSRGSNSKQLDDVNKEVIHLTDQIRSLDAENGELKEKLRTLSMHLIDAGRRNEDDIDFDPNSDVLDVPAIELLSIIAGLNHKNGLKPVQSKSIDFDENRLEDLETRVTQLNTELAKLLKLKLKVENGLQDLDRCRDFDEARKKAKYLWYESRATQIFVEPQMEEDSPVSLSPIPTDTSSTKPQLQPQSEPQATLTKPQNSFPPAIRLNLERVHIATPPGKLPADTHINDMHHALKQIVVQELSLYKGNGSDWRLFAERVGIPSQLITQWKTMRLPQPMKNVLYVWGDSPGATVRMLHRHLTSPQMKCVLLAKRLSDFYEVN